MYELKRIPEDFVVEEVQNRKFSENIDQGKYLVFLLQKINYNTEDAVQRIADYYKIQRKNIGYAGAKDRNAITSQYITILGVSRKDLELKDIKLKFVGFTNVPISLGDLEGNKFIITIRNIENEKIEFKKEFINYFDEQRFSFNNADIGKAIINRNYELACKIIIDENSKNSVIVKEALEKNSKAFLNALKAIPKKTLMLYVHAFQSKIWNDVVEKLDKENIEMMHVPLPGFSIELSDTIKGIYDKVMENENISFRDFILRDFPEISLEGANRLVKVDIINLQISELIDDDLNSGKKKVMISFFLPKGAYATMAIKNIVKNIVN